MYEYTVVDRHFADRGTTEINLLGKYGRDGWKLCSVVMFGSFVRYYFTRRTA